VLGVPRKLVKYVVHSSKNNLKKNYFSSYKLLKLQLKKKIPVWVEECYVAYKFHPYFEDAEDPLSVYKCHT
jgi:hypothetical protein